MVGRLRPGRLMPSRSISDVAAELPERVRTFLQRPNPAVMATLAKDGRPVSVVTWYLLEPDGGVMLNLDGDRVRLRHLRRDPRIALTVLDGADWGSHVSLQLSVVDVAGRPIRQESDLALSLLRFKPGDTVTLTVLRGGATRHVRVKLGERPLDAPQG